ncbi:hypothetical protein HMPREF0662_00533 [Prevotella nigrescens F0103]|nr:hypothetical protein HMPREF0662_00533 [Prevotella nigrescens F0103]
MTYFDELLSLFSTNGIFTELQTWGFSYYRKKPSYAIPMLMAGSSLYPFFRFR